MAILKEMEIINYSIYNSNISIDIDRYISEHETILMTMLTRSLQGETNLLIAPTGSGKTYSIINMLKKLMI